ncbi:multiheme cytochrome, precursor [Mycolicibacterium brisbanense]|uniref:Multiheme cytochrome n=1 Tax=Mycolicibacterium brisbanense TaxID=146020 RepID=A0A100W1U0_9MYCO|nr:multiheme cytochrome, precursor [Mycolicibacterium brisbanense]
MPARTEGAVDEHRLGSIAVTTGQRGAEQFDTAVQQDWDMPVVTHVRVHTNTSAMACPCDEVSVRNLGPGVGEVRQGRLGQRPRRTGLVRVSVRIK